MFEKKLVFTVSISGALLIILMIAHSYYFAREFTSPTHIALSQISGNGYTGAVSLEKGVMYGLVVGAEMHRSHEKNFKTLLRLSINNIEVDVVWADRVVGNNTSIKSEWVSQANQLLYKKVYFGDFISPESCTECKIEIQGHSQLYLTRYTAEIHRNVSHSYYVLGYALAICSVVFILACFVALPYAIYKYVYKFYMS